MGTWKNIPATLEGVKCKEANDAVKHKNLNAWKVTVEWVANEDLGDVEFRFCFFNKSFFKLHFFCVYVFICI